MMPCDAPHTCPLALELLDESRLATVLQEEGVLGHEVVEIAMTPFPAKLVPVAPHCAVARGHSLGIFFQMSPRPARARIADCKHSLAAFGHAEHGFEASPSL